MRPISFLFYFNFGISKFEKIIIIDNRKLTRMIKLFGEPIVAQLEFAREQ